MTTQATPKNSQALQDIVRALRLEDGFLVTCHASPDGDAIGSMAAVGHILSRLGKRFALYNQDGLPEDFDWLPLPAPVIDTLPEDYGNGGKLPWTITLDCGDLFRVGDELAGRVNREKLINIDHHLGNPEFGVLNWVDTTQASTGQMIAALAGEMGFPPDGDLGQAIYLTLVTDTGSFAYDNTTPRTLELAAQIMRLGLEPGPFNAHIRNQQTMPRMKLSSQVLNDAQLYDDGTIGLIRITADVMQDTGTTIADADGIINSLRRLKGVKVSVALREDAPESIKISLRSQGDINVQPVAAHFGGGGHKNAAGATIKAPLEAAEKQILDAVRDYTEGL